MFLTLRDGTVFKGNCLSSCSEAVGILSIYTGAFGYEEVITNPANTGKIMLFTFPIIGASGINHQDNQSDTVCTAGVICKEYSRVMSNFRAKETLLHYLDSAGCAMGEGFDTRAILVHLREAGEQPAVLSEKELTPEEAAARMDSFEVEYYPVNSPIEVSEPVLRANVVDFGGSKSFYGMLAESRIACVEDGEDFDVCIVSNAPHYILECDDIAAMIEEAAAGKPVVGFGDGAAIAALSAGYRIEQQVLGHHGTNIPVKPVCGCGRNSITSQNHCFVVPEQEGIRITAVNLHDGTTEAFVSEDGMVRGFCFRPESLINILKGKEN